MAAIVKNGNYRSFNTLLIILLVIIIFGSIIASFINFSGKNLFEGFTSGETVSIEYYYMSGCPHCVKFEPIWKSFEEKSKGSKQKYTLKSYNINEPEGSERGSKFNVNSAPTILAIKNNSIKDTLDGERTLDTLTAFANKNSS